MEWSHVSRRIKEKQKLKVEKIKTYLKCDFPEVICKAVVSLLYTSFRITLNLHNFDKVMNPESWSEGT